MKKIMIVLLFIFLIKPISTYANQGQLLLLVKSSNQSLYQSTLAVESNYLFTEIANSKPIEKFSELPLSTKYLILENNGIVKIFLMDDLGVFYDLQRKEKIKLSPKTTKKLTTFFKVLHGKHFGQLVKWEKAKELIPKYKKFKITDLETGLSFYVQRRAGSNHADVQPLTRKDTKIFKQVYGGKWSWKRRSVLVHTDQQIIAASMHGMPHGRGSLANGFPGHFCIHFKDSVTHTTKNMDLTHQVMVYKAGGFLSQFVKQLPADDVVSLFFIALNQNDRDLFSLLYREDTSKYDHFFSNIEFAKMTKRNKQTIDEALVYEIPIKFVVKEKGQKEVEHYFHFRLVRDSLTSEWKFANFPF